MVQKEIEIETKEEGGKGGGYQSCPSFCFLCEHPIRRPYGNDIILEMPLKREKIKKPLDQFPHRLPIHTRPPICIPREINIAPLAL